MIAYDLLPAAGFWCRWGSCEFEFLRCSYKLLRGYLPCMRMKNLSQKRHSEREDARKCLIVFPISLKQ